MIAISGSSTISQGHVLFVQVGESGHAHPPLRGVLDLRGKTTLRELVRLVYHAQGVLCPVTLMMHLAAAVECPPGRVRNRPCVVVAGGREPPHWEAYPHHQFLHRAGALRCCENGGCWKSRVVPLGDGDEKDAPENCCVDVVGTLPRCMDLIAAEDVIRAIEVYFAGGAIDYLTDDEARSVAEVLARVNRRDRYVTVALDVEDRVEEHRIANAVMYAVQCRRLSPAAFAGLLLLGLGGRGGNLDRNRRTLREVCQHWRLRQLDVGAQRRIRANRDFVPANRPVAVVVRIERCSLP